MKERLNDKHENEAIQKDTMNFQEDNSYNSNSSGVISVSREDYDKVIQAMRERLTKFLNRYGLEAELDESDDSTWFGGEYPHEIDTDKGRVTINEASVITGALMDTPEEEYIRCVIDIELPIVANNFDINDYDVFKEAIMDLKDMDLVDRDSFNLMVKKAQETNYHLESRAIKLRGFECLDGIVEFVYVSRSGQYYSIEYTIHSEGWRVGY